jgi:hypothetical protein
MSFVSRGVQTKKSPRDAGFFMDWLNDAFRMRVSGSGKPVACVERTAHTQGER